MYQNQSKWFGTLYLYGYSLYCVDLLFHCFILLPYLALYGPVAIKLRTSVKKRSKVRDKRSWHGLT